MEWQEKLKSYLQDIGLHEEGEFSVYFELLVNNFGKDFKASEIAEKVSMNRSYVYNVLSNLVDKGLVTIVLGSSPKSYVAQNPLAYVDKQINEHETSLKTLESFKQFIKDEIAPELDKIKQLTSTPVKETFFINSSVKLTNYVNKALSKCESRIIMKISSEFLESIKINLEKSIERLIKNGKKNDVRIICSISKQEEIGFKDKELFAFSDQSTNEYQIIIDDDVYLFNLQSNPFIQPFGAGIMIKEPKIAESFSFSLISSFKQIIYDNLPVSSVKDLSQVIQKDKQFCQSLENIFSKGWKVFFAGSYPEGNYYSLVAPQKVKMQEIRDAGILYQPFNDKNKQDIMNEVFDEAKTYSFQGAFEGKKRFDIDFEVNIKKDFIEGFECKILEYSSKITLISPWNLDISGNLSVDVKNEKNNRSNKPIEIKSRMAVINYLDRAAVMVWSLLDDNLVAVLKELRKNIT